MLIQLTERGADPTSSLSQQAIVGIDFGTTHSVVAWAPPHEAVRIIPLEEESPLLPSVFWVSADKVLVGRRAMGQDAIFSIKRSLEDSSLAEAIQGTTHILRHLKETAQKAIDKPITYAVITVPAYFSERARSAIRLAAHQAEISVLRLLNEPTAAALAYGIDNLYTQGLILVYDLGGGTFDVSLLRLSAGLFQVVATAGDVALGGDDIDALIQKDLGDMSPKGLLLARHIKETLTTHNEGSWEVAPGVFYRLTRDRLDALVTPLIDRTLAITESVIKDAGLSPQDIDDILLVGGATRMPLVARRVQDILKRTPRTILDPDLSVAKGAALQARALTQGSDTLLLDVTPLSLAIETLGGQTEKLILRNSPLPASATEIFTTTHDNQSGIVVHVVQGESKNVAECRSLGRFVLKGLPPLPAGAPRVAITFTLDTEGLLTVSAHEPTLGLLQQLEIVPGQNLSHTELSYLLQQVP